MTGTYWLEKGPLGYLCDSEWDGDAFTKDPRQVPIDYFKNTNLAHTKYQWAQVTFFEVSFDSHDYRCTYKRNGRKFFYCQNCNARTKDYADTKALSLAFANLPTRCFRTDYFEITQR